MKIVVVGGGPAGMLAAISASKENKNEVLLIEKNEKLGKKLFITGKGRCNVTNNCDKDDFFKNIVRNSKFIYSAFNEFSNKDLQNLIKENGCKLKVERGNRVFPESDKAYDITDAFKRILKRQSVKISLNTEVIDIDSEKNITVKNSENNKKEIIKADKVIIATGGLAYPTTGSTGDGYKFAKKFGINVITCSPSLVPIEVFEKDECKKLEDLTLKNISIKIFEKENKKPIYEDFGELEFMSYGLSGPVILSASSYLDFSNDMVYHLSIDLKPALDEEKLDARLLREFSENKNEKLIKVYETLLPKQMIEIFERRVGISDIKVSDVTKETRRKIVSLLKSYDFILTKKRGYDEAIVTSGGIDVKELNPKTMESKKVSGIYFVGEVVDVNALTGGFNIQLATSMGYVAGKFI